MPGLECRHRDVEGARKASLGGPQRLIHMPSAPKTGIVPSTVPRAQAVMIAAAAHARLSGFEERQAIEEAHCAAPAKRW
jgi:hypothetical protein